MKQAKKFSDLKKKPLRLGELDINLIDNEMISNLKSDIPIELKDEDFMLTISEYVHTKKNLSKNSSIISSNNDLLSQASAFRLSATSRRLSENSQSYVNLKETVDEEELAFNLNVGDQTVEKLENENIIDNENIISTNKSIDMNNIIERNKPMSINNLYSFP
jgi:hypothetical protein